MDRQENGKNVMLMDGAQWTHWNPRTTIGRVAPAKDARNSRPGRKENPREGFPGAVVIWNPTRRKRLLVGVISRFRQHFKANPIALGRTREIVSGMEG